MHNSSKLHLHLRRKGKKFSKGSAFERALDNFVCVAAGITPLMTIPQVIKIWTLRDAESLSLVTWVTYAVINVFWLVYGIRHKTLPLIINSVLWSALYVFILTGIVLFG